MTYLGYPLCLLSILCDFLGLLYELLVVLLYSTFFLVLHLSQPPYLLLESALFLFGLPLLPFLDFIGSLLRWPGREVVVLLGRFLFHFRRLFLELCHLFVGGCDLDRDLHLLLFNSILLCLFNLHISLVRLHLCFNTRYLVI